MYSNINGFIEQKKKYIETERARLKDEMSQLKSLDRSGSSAIAGGAGDGMGDAVGRRLSGHPAGDLGPDVFRGKARQLLIDRLRDKTDKLLGPLQSMSSKLFGSLSFVTMLDPNRARFDLVQRATESLNAKVSGLTEKAGDILSEVTEARALMADILPSQGAWFSDPVNGFKKNAVAASVKMDAVDAAVSKAMEAMESGRLMRDEERQALRDALASVREEIVPLNASLRPEAGVDHPQAAALTAAAKLARIKDRLESKIASYEREHSSYENQKRGIQDYSSDDNTIVKGDASREQAKQVVSQIKQQAGSLRGALANITGSSGTAAVFTNVEEWVANIETSIMQLDSPMLQLAVVPEDGGAYDAATADIVSSFSDLTGQLAGEAVPDAADGIEAMRSLAAACSSCLNSNGMSMADIDDLVSRVTSLSDGLSAHASSIQSIIANAPFMDGRVPKLGQVTELLDMVQKGGLDTAEELLTSGALYSDGVATKNSRTVDSRGAFAEELRKVAAEVTDVTVVNRTRLERAHRILETDERRRKRVSTSHEDAIEEAELETSLEILELDQLERELDRLTEELSA